MFILHSITIFYTHFEPNKIFIQPHYQIRTDHTKLYFYITSKFHTEYTTGIKHGTNYGGSEGIQAEASVMSTLTVE